MNKFTNELTKSHDIMSPDSRLHSVCKAVVHWWMQSSGFHWMRVDPHHRALIGRRLGYVDAQTLCEVLEPLLCSQKDLH